MTDPVKEQPPQEGGDLCLGDEEEDDDGEFMDPAMFSPEQLSPSEAELAALLEKADEDEEESQIGGVVEKKIDEEEEEEDADCNNNNKSIDSDELPVRQLVAFFDKLEEEQGIQRPQQDQVADEEEKVEEQHPVPETMNENAGDDDDVDGRPEPVAELVAFFDQLEAQQGGRNRAKKKVAASIEDAHQVAELVAFFDETKDEEEVQQDDDARADGSPHKAYPVDEPSETDHNIGLQLEDDDDEEEEPENYALSAATPRSRSLSPELPDQVRGNSPLPQDDSYFHVKNALEQAEEDLDRNLETMDEHDYLPAVMEHLNDDSDDDDDEVDPDLERRVMKYLQRDLYNAEQEMMNQQLNWHQQQQEQQQQGATLADVPPEEERPLPFLAEDDEGKDHEDDSVSLLTSGTPPKLDLQSSPRSVMVEVYAVPPQPRGSDGSSQYGESICSYYSSSSTNRMRRLHQVVQELDSVLSLDDDVLFLSQTTAGGQNEGEIVRNEEQEEEEDDDDDDSPDLPRLMVTETNGGRPWRKLVIVFVLGAVAVVVLWYYAGRTDLHYLEILIGRERNAAEEKEAVVLPRATHRYHSPDKGYGNSNNQRRQRRKQKALQKSNAAASRSAPERPSFMSWVITPSPVASSSATKEAPPKSSQETMAKSSKADQTEQEVDEKKQKGLLGRLFRKGEVDPSEKVAKDRAASSNGNKNRFSSWWQEKTTASMTFLSTPPEVTSAPLSSSTSCNMGTASMLCMLKKKREQEELARTAVAVPKDKKKKQRRQKPADETKQQQLKQEV